MLIRDMDGVLNESTRTVHKHQLGDADFQSECGATADLSHDKLRVVPVELASSDTDVIKCGRCFDDAGGY